MGGFGRLPLESLAPYRGGGTSIRVTEAPIGSAGAFFMPYACRLMVSLSSYLAWYALSGVAMLIALMALLPLDLVIRVVLGWAVASALLIPGYGQYLEYRATRRGEPPEHGA